MAEMSMDERSKSASRRTALQGGAQVFLNQHAREMWHVPRVFPSAALHGSRYSPASLPIPDQQLHTPVFSAALIGRV